MDNFITFYLSSRRIILFIICDRPCVVCKIIHWLSSSRPPTVRHRETRKGRAEKKGRWSGSEETSSAGGTAAVIFHVLCTSYEKKVSRRRSVLVVLCVFVRVVVVYFFPRFMNFLRGEQQQLEMLKSRKILNRYIHVVEGTS